MPAMFTHIESSLTVVQFCSTNFKKIYKHILFKALFVQTENTFGKQSSKASVITIYAFFSHIYYAISLLKTVGTPINTG